MEKNKSNKESRQFWTYVEKTAARVEKWPEWKRSVIEDSLGTMKNSNRRLINGTSRLKKTVNSAK